MKKLLLIFSIVVLGVCFIIAQSTDNVAQQKALEALRKKEAELDARKPGEEAISANNEAQEKALKALRQKEAELDTKKASIAITPTKTPAKTSSTTASSKRDEKERTSVEKAKAQEETARKNRETDLAKRTEAERKALEKLKAEEAQRARLEAKEAERQISAKSKTEEAARKNKAAKELAENKARAAEQARRAEAERKDVEKAKAEEAQRAEAKTKEAARKNKELAENKARAAEQAKRAETERKAMEKAKAEDARKSKAQAEALAKAKSREQAETKAREIEAAKRVEAERKALDKAQMEAAAYKAQEAKRAQEATKGSERERATPVVKTAPSVNSLTQESKAQAKAREATRKDQELAESKARKAELARQAEAERQALKKLRAEEAQRAELKAKEAARKNKELAESKAREAEQAKRAQAAEKLQREQQSKAAESTRKKSAELDVPTVKTKPSSPSQPAWSVAVVPSTQETEGQAKAIQALRQKEEELDRKQQADAKAVIHEGELFKIVKVPKNEDAAPASKSKVAAVTSPNAREQAQAAETLRKKEAKLERERQNKAREDARIQVKLAEGKKKAAEELAARQAAEDRAARQAETARQAQEAEAARRAKASAEAMQRAKSSEEAAKKAVAKEAAEKARLAEIQAKKAKADEALKTAQAEEAARNLKEVEEARKKAEIKEAARREKESRELAQKQEAARQKAAAEAQKHRAVPATPIVKTPSGNAKTKPSVAPVVSAPIVSSDETKALEQLQAKREAQNAQSSERLTWQRATTDVPGAVPEARSRYSRNAQSQYYEELWQKELEAKAAKAASGKKGSATASSPVVSRTYYDELWQKEQEAKAARQVAGVSKTKEKTVSSSPDKAVAKEVAARKKAEAARQKAERETASKKAKEMELAQKKSAQARDEEAKKARELEQDMKKKAEQETSRRKAAEAQAVAESKMREETARKEVQKETVQKEAAQREAARLALEAAEASKRAQAAETAARQAQAEAAAKLKEAQNIQEVQPSVPPVSETVKSSSSSTEVEAIKTTPLPKESPSGQIVYDGDLFRIVKVGRGRAEKLTENPVAQRQALEALRQKERELDAAQEQQRQKEQEAKAIKKAAAPASKATQDTALQQRVKTEEENARQARLQAEELARKAKEAEEVARKAEAREAAARNKVSEESAKADRMAEEASRKREMAMNRQTHAEVAKKSLPPTAEGSPDREKTPAKSKKAVFQQKAEEQPLAVEAANFSTEEMAAQSRALEALRKKQLELDALESQVNSQAAVVKGRSPVESTKKQPSTFAVSSTVPPAVIQAQSQALSALQQKQSEEADADARSVAASSAEVQAVRKKLSQASDDRKKLKDQIVTAERDLADKKGQKGASTGKVEVIVDNNQAQQVGAWATGKTGGFYGANYAFKGRGPGSSYIVFKPNLPVAGEYEVFEWHVSGQNRASDAPFFVSDSKGGQNIQVDQQVNGAQWNSLGKFHFEAGTSGEVRISDGILVQGQMVMADAVRFVLVSGSAPDAATAAVDTTALQKEIENLRAKLEAAEAQESKWKAQAQAAEKRLAEEKLAAEERAAERARVRSLEEDKLANLKASSSRTAVIAAPENDTEDQLKAIQALRTKEQELGKTKKIVEPKKGASKPMVAAIEARPLTEKEKKLAELLRRYKVDEITPRQYHQERAKIIAEP